MKKFTLFLTILLTLVLLPASVFAENSKWKSPHYDFKNVQTLNLTSIFMAEENNDNFTTDEMAPGKIFSALKMAAGKKKLDITIDNQKDLRQLVNPADADALTYKTEIEPLTQLGLAAKNTLVLNLIVRRFGCREYFIPAHQVIRTVHETERYRDNHGNWLERVFPRTVYDFIPAHNAYDVEIDFTWNLYDPTTGKVVMNIHDVRIREDDLDTEGMMKRMVGLFVQELTKN
jgi:hypothetical protein